MCFAEKAGQIILSYFVFLLAISKTQALGHIYSVVDIIQEIYRRVAESAEHSYFAWDFCPLLKNCSGLE